MKNTIEHSGKVNEPEIALVAYQMWETAGQPAGQDLRFWFDAQAQLRANAKPAPATPASQGSPVELRNSTAPKAANVQFGPSQPIPSKPQQKFRKF